MGVKIDIDDGVRIPKINDLRFVRTDSRSGYLQNKDEYLITEITYPNFNYGFCYFPKFNIGDLILNQFIVNVTIDSVLLKDVNDNTISDLTGDLTEIRSIETDDYSTVTYYNHEIDTTTLDGVYYLLVTAGTTQTYKSEYFKAKSMTALDGCYLEYYNDIATKYDDGAYFNGSMAFKMWLDSRNWYMKTGQEKTIFDGFNGKIEIMKGQPKRLDTLEIDAVYWFMIEKLNIALQHDNFSINGISYQTDSELDIKTSEINAEGNLVYSGSIDLRPVNYENYLQIIESEPEIQNNILTSDDEADYLIYGTDSTTRIIWKNE